MAQPIAIYDACVLYPAPLRDFLMQLALTDLFQAKWTERIHDEWIRSVLKNRPDLNKDQLEKTRRLMNTATRDCLVEGYDALIEAVIRVISTPASFRPCSSPPPVIGNLRTILSMGRGF